MAVAALMVMVSPATAQQIPLAEVLPRMLGPDMTIAPGPGGTHARDFAPQIGEPDLVFGPLYGSEPVVTTQPRGFFFNAAIIESLATFPISSSSGGFLYDFDPVTGTFTQSSRSFGPSYGERALTSGRGTVAVGFGVQHVDYDGLDGEPLDPEVINFYYVHRDLAGPSPVPLTPERSDVIHAAMRLRVRRQTTWTTVTYGVSNRLDIGATVPIVRTTLEARVDKRILRSGTFRDRTIHSFDGQGADTATASGGGTASGLGDLRVLAKYNVFRRNNLAVAALGDVRLPTGDSRNLLGTGTTLTRILGIVSFGTRNFSPHVNVGATFASGNSQSEELVGEPADELDLTGGFAWSVHPRVTLNVDFLSRFRRGAGVKMDILDRTLRSVGTLGGPEQITTVKEFQPTRATHTYLYNTVFGAKVRAWRTMLLVANVFGTGDILGLRNRPFPSFGVEYTF